MKSYERAIAFVCVIVLISTSSTDAFSFQQHRGITTAVTKSNSLFPQPRNNRLYASTTSVDERDSLKKKIKAEGGKLAFNCKYGALNPYAIYYGVTAILLGLPWFLELMLTNLLYIITRGKVDSFKRLPVFFSQMWGVLLMFFSQSFPKIIGKEKLNEFYKQDRSAMFVANHNSWMDIPFVGYTIGWRNYKFISKAELGKVPILGRSIKTGGHLMIDRSDRRSQIRTIKAGMQWLKDGVHLVTFPEGTRSKTGRLLPFKSGAFKMAHKTGSPVIPCSIINAAEAHPHHWMFPCKPSKNLCKIIIHDPIESIGKTEQELATEVRNTIISGLPEEQKPLLE
eukprot:CAMPEP_0197832828 /NCGR_PEP_ID=MMETSP1437-20131217/16400_1 /TAXON_ID=49252 ORGANISM="Eucampia antarctica, Strain CCMP1452" /NCGR_SAMPLE_ID=MMETSP1437 /ASSEMBLY_ACC=CAM_ASM_001096 /LENGTH=338 /DNA_ID=CAMNT_0043436433 /DNA_START=44 /DNA_END=1060 /DNA_ORIENTATION=+